MGIYFNLRQGQSLIYSKPPSVSILEWHVDDAYLSYHIFSIKSLILHLLTPDNSQLAPVVEDKDDSLNNRPQINPVPQQLLRINLASHPFLQVLEEILLPGPRHWQRTSCQLFRGRFYSGKRVNFVKNSCIDNYFEIYYIGNRRILRGKLLAL